MYCTSSGVDVINKAGTISGQKVYCINFVFIYLHLHTACDSLVTLLMHLHSKLYVHA